jgi:hypothetical protein
MAAGNRVVVALFALAVALSLAAVAWIVLHSAPAGETGRHLPPPSAERPPRPVPPTPKPNRTSPTDRPKRIDPSKPRSPFEVWGEVRGPDDVPVPGADVVVLSLSRKEVLQPSLAPGPERLAAEVLRECFALEPDEAVKMNLYSGVPAMPGEGAPGGAAAPPGTESRELRRAATGEDGKFRIQVPGKGPFRIEARKEGVGSAVASDVVAVDAANPGPPLVLRLGPSAALSGRVSSNTGSAPVEGAVVVVRAGGIARGARSGPDGTFSVPDLPPGKYSLVAGAPGFAPVTLPVEAPSAAPVEVVLGSGFAARVNVMKREIPPPGTRPQRGVPPPRGAPLEGALVVLLHRQTQTYRSGVTGPDGTVVIDRLGMGRWQVSVRKEGFGLGVGREIDFKAGSPPEDGRDVRLFPIVKTPVSLLDEAGSPVRNARVFSGGLDEDFDERHSVQIGKTDDDGRIEISFDDGVPWKSVVWVVPEDGAAMKVEPEDPILGTEVKAVVRPGRVVQGTVTDAKGQAVKGAQVHVEVMEDEHDIDVSLYVYTDDKGSYRFPSLPWGDVSLEVDAEGDSDSQEVDAEVKDNPLVRDFRLGAEEPPKK